METTGKRREGTQDHSPGWRITLTDPAMGAGWSMTEHRPRLCECTQLAWDFCLLAFVLAAVVLAVWVWALVVQ